jgi:hypothetical protein
LEGGSLLPIRSLEEFAFASGFLQKRVGNLSFLLGYTLSKAMDNASFFNNRMNYSNHRLSK